MDWKQEQEWVIMRYFKEKYQKFPKGKLIKSESPDFQLWISPKRFIGIELTQIHQIIPENQSQCVLSYESAEVQVEKTVLSKEEKIRLYRSDHPHQLWLIIFADYSEPNAMQKIIKENLVRPTANSFDRLFLFDLDSQIAYSLK
jgi:hypothetical protein